MMIEYYTRLKIDALINTLLIYALVTIIKTWLFHKLKCTVNWGEKLNSDSCNMALTFIQSVHWVMLFSHPVYQTTK